MNKMKLYIETTPGEYERVDMFEDENVIMNIKLKDLSFIDKVFSTYTQTFTLPLSGKNKIIFNYFFTPGVRTINNPNKGRSLNAKIAFNDELFKVGFVVISNSRNESSITLNFYTGAATLKETIGDDLLSSLPISNTLEWTDSNVFDRIKNSYSTSIVPLISTSRVWEYDTTGTDDIKYTGPAMSGRKVIDKDELRPALNIRRIINGIVNKYGLNLSFPLYDRPEFWKLFIWCNSKSSSDTSEKLLPLNNNFNPIDIHNGLVPEYAVSGNTFTDEFEITKLSSSNDQSGEFSIAYTPTRVLNTGEDLTIRLEFIDIRTPSNDVIYTINNVIPAGETSKYFNNDLVFTPSSTYGLSTTIPLKFKIRIKTSSPVSWPTMTYYMTIREIADTSKWAIQNSISNTSADLNPINLKLIDYIPTMKVIDFLDSLFKMFNIRVREENYSNKMFWETPEDFYPNGVEKDYTKYLDNVDNVISTQDVYKNYTFQHRMPKYNSSVAYKEANVDNINSKEFGQLIYKMSDVLYASGEYKIETKFYIMVPRLIQNTQVQTFYGFMSGDPTPKTGSIIGDSSTGYEYKPNWDEFTIFYAMGSTYLYKQTPTPFDFSAPYATLGFNNNGVVESFNSANHIGIADNINNIGSGANAYKNSLGFKDELNIQFNQFIYERNLFSNYYADTIARLNNPDVFTSTYKFILPIDEINTFDMRNSIIVGEMKYQIEEANLNLTTGKVSLKLINIAPPKIV